MGTIHSLFCRAGHHDPPGTSLCLWVFPGAPAANTEPHIALGGAAENPLRRVPHPCRDPPGHGGVHGEGGVGVPEAPGRDGVHGLALPADTRGLLGKRPLSPVHRDPWNGLQAISILVIPTTSSRGDLLPSQPPHPTPGARGVPELTG